ncbi:glutamate-rich protein 2 isoform X2 [Ambystoma mexicanum]|uniref:glutamate-rich protein 2 isoform X2 n=1 Tax=Ambystoma mexicanum TaxID=8296 RepID=UPI0037E822C1
MVAPIEESCGPLPNNQIGKPGNKDGFVRVREPYVSVRRLSSSEKADVLIKGSRDWQKGKLQVLGPKEEVMIPKIETPEWSASVGSRHISARKKVYSPTKQISLCSTRTSQELNDTPIKDWGDRKTACNSAPNLRSSNGIHINTCEQGTVLRKETEAKSNVITNNNIKGNLQESTDDSDTDSSSDEHDEKNIAPIELMAEFLKAVMDRDFKLSSKLCQMILIYEPENSEAQQFIPLIEEKLLMEENEQNTENEDDEETDEESSDSGDSTDSSKSEGDSDDTSDTSSEDEDNL